MGGAGSRTHAGRCASTSDEVREFFGEDLREEIEQLIAMAARDDGDGPRIAHADIARVIDGLPLDASMRTSRVVRVDGLLARVPAAVLAAGVCEGKTGRDIERARSKRYEDGDDVIEEGSSEPEYRVECFIPRGGFGDVYKVLQLLEQKQQEEEEKR